MIPDILPVHLVISVVVVALGRFREVSLQFADQKQYGPPEPVSAKPSLLERFSTSLVLGQSHTEEKASTKDKLSELI